MEEIRGKDCPLCGSKNTVVYETGRTATFKSKKYPTLVVEDVDGHFCSACKDGFYSKESTEKIGNKMREVAKQYADN